jgi:glycosyltransferase involved in cell wall biosynthesis
MARHSVRRLLSREYDVLECYGGEAWLAFSLLARWPNRRFLLVCHSNGVEPHCEEVLGAVTGGQSWYSALPEQAFHNADAVVTVADYDRKYVLREGYVPAERALAIENPLPDSFLGLPLDPERGPVIGYCGSWTPLKGIALLARDIPRLLRDLPGWRLTLVGVGAGFRAAEHFPADLLPRIAVVPHADRETELRALYRTFAILLLPSLYESFGLAAAEGMACGCALVANRVGFAAGLRHGEEAMLLSASAPSLYDAVRALAQDPGLRRRIARGGHRRVQSLSWESAVARLEAAYGSWLAELKGRA